MNQEIINAYRDLKLTPIDIDNIEQLNEEVSRIKSAWREIIKNYHGDSARVVASDVLSARVNSAYLNLKEYVEELRQVLAEQSQEIENKEKSEPVYPQHDKKIIKWDPQKFEKQKASEAYNDKSGFEKGLKMNKIA